MLFTFVLHPVALYFAQLIWRKFPFYFKQWLENLRLLISPQIIHFLYDVFTIYKTHVLNWHLYQRYFAFFSQPRVIFDNDLFDGYGGHFSTEWTVVMSPLVMDVHSICWNLRALLSEIDSIMKLERTFITLSSVSRALICRECPH